MEILEAAVNKGDTSFVILTKYCYTVIKTRKMRWAGPVARKGEVRNGYKILVKEPEGTDPLEDLDVDGWITLEWT
jgi:hypothetical protein